jgi:tetratricopeptide (TPR) repeat protein
LLVALGDLQFARETPEQAEPLYRRALELDPATAAAESGLGQIAIHRRDWAAAVRHFERTLQLAPYAAVVNYQLGLAHRHLGNLDRARTLMANRADRKPTVADPLMDEVKALIRGSRIRNNRGTRLFGEGKYAEALEQFELARKSTPDDTDVLINMSSALVALGRTDEALAILNRIVELDPAHVMAYYNLGTLAARARDDANAIRYYRLALAADPANTQSHFNLGNALRRQGRFEQALPHYRQVVLDDPANTVAWLAEALTLIRLERWSEARSRLDEGVASFPNDQQLLNALVRLLAAAPDATVRDGSRAVELAQHLLSLKNSLPFLEAYAMALAETGDFGLAAARQDEALQAVRQAGRQELIGPIAANLELYRAGRPCRAPWPADDPLLSP